MAPLCALVKDVLIEVKNIQRGHLPCLIDSSEAKNLTQITQNTQIFEYVLRLTEYQDIQLQISKKARLTSKKIRQILQDLIFESVDNLTAAAYFSTISRSASTH